MKIIKREVGKYFSQYLKQKLNIVKKVYVNNRNINTSSFNY